MGFSAIAKQKVSRKCKCVILQGGLRERERDLRRWSPHEGGGKASPFSKPPRLSLVGLDGVCGRKVGPPKLHKLREPARPLQRFLGSSGPETGKSPESLWKVSGECFGMSPRLFGDVFGFPGPEGPFETFSAIRAWRAQHKFSTSAVSAILRFVSGKFRRVFWHPPSPLVWPHESGT